MTRAPEPTRERLIEAALGVFAEHGYAGGSVRAIVRAAGANQAAINYHFGSKDGLYRAVLERAVRELSEQPPLDAARIAELGRAVALRLFLRAQFAPLLRRGQLARVLRLFAWENLSPTPVFRAFIRDDPPPALASAGALARAFLPEAAPDEIAIATIWLIQQPAIFVRNAETLGEPPLALTLDPAGVERLVEVVGRLVLAGLAGGARSV